MYDYYHELLRSIAGSTIKVTTTFYQGTEADLKNPNAMVCRHFHIVYVYFKGCSDIFFKCRPIIGLDGRFLKGYYGGTLLAAIGRDPSE